MKSKKSITAAKWSGVSAAILLVAVFVLPGAGVNLAFLGNQVGSGGSPLAIGDNAGAGTGGVTQELARDAFERASAKLPLKTKFITKE